MFLRTLASESENTVKAIGSPNPQIHWQNCGHFSPCYWEIQTSFRTGSLLKMCSPVQSPWALGCMMHLLLRMMFDWKPSCSSASALGHPEESSCPDISEHLPGVSCDLQWHKRSDYFGWNRQWYQGMFDVCVTFPFHLSPLSEVMFSNFWDCGSFPLYTNYKEDSNLDLVFLLSCLHWLPKSRLHDSSCRCHQGPDS